MYGLPENSTTDEDGQLDPVVSRGPPLVPSSVSFSATAEIPVAKCRAPGYCRFMILGFHHAGVATPDMERLSRFYVDLFHGRILGEFEWDDDAVAMSARLGLAKSAGRLMMLGFGGARLELFQFDWPAIALPDVPPSVARPGFSHICFEVDDIRAEFTRLSDAGMTFHAQPMTMPAGGAFTYGRDPDGNVVELLQAPG